MPAGSRSTPGWGISVQGGRVSRWTVSDLQDLLDKWLLCGLAGDARDRLPDHVGDGLRLGDHDHVGSLDLGDRRPGTLGHGTDDIAAGGLVASGYDGPRWQVLPAWRPVAFGEPGGGDGALR